jgi:esterase/lipase
MNLNPLKMDELAQTFASFGYEVLRPGFCGHHGDPEELLGVTAKEWEDDAHRIHAEAQTRANELGVPMYLLAYSFSGLIFQVMSKELPFAKRVYLAPALALHFWYLPLMWLVRWIPWLTFRSVIPREYRASETSGLYSVLAMDRFYVRWKLGEGRETGGPTLIYAARRDELVHGPKLAELAMEIPGWEFRETNVASSTLPKSFHHLIIDSASLGPEQWTTVVNGAREFFER